MSSHHHPGVPVHPKGTVAPAITQRCGDEVKLTAATLSEMGPYERLTFSIQGDSQGADKEANWLPAASGVVRITMRIYWPNELVVRGTWKPPAVKQGRSLGDRLNRKGGEHRGIDWLE